MYSRPTIASIIYSQEFCQMQLIPQSHTTSQSKFTYIRQLLLTKFCAATDLLLISLRKSMSMNNKNYS